MRYADGDQGQLGFPVAATISALTTIGTSVVGGFVGDSAAEKRAELLRRRRNRQQARRYVEDELSRIQQEEISAKEAERILNQDGTVAVRGKEFRWRDDLQEIGLQDVNPIVEEMKSQAQTIYKEKASTRLFWSRAPQMIATGGIGIGILAAGYGLTKSITDGVEPQDPDE